MLNVLKRQKNKDFWRPTSEFGLSRYSEGSVEAETEGMF